MLMFYRDPDIPPPWTYSPGQCYPGHFRSLFTWCRIFPPTTTTWHHHPPINNIKRSTINVYKIDKGYGSDQQMFRKVKYNTSGYFSGFGIWGCQPTFGGPFLPFSSPLPFPPPSPSPLSLFVTHAKYAHSSEKQNYKIL